jgi:hypothetical protein
MNRKIKNSIWMVAIAIGSFAMSLTACSSDDIEVNSELGGKENVEQSTALAAYAIDSQGTRSGGEVKTAVFTDEDIEWFDLNTRELRFGIDSEAIYNRLESLDRIEFRLGDDVLFQVDNIVNPTFSRPYFDLVLYYDWTWENDEKVGVGYYLYDCYPQQFVDEELTKNNRNKRVEQWKAFTDFLESKGKLKK